MHHPTDRIAHTTAFVTPVVEHWLERSMYGCIYIITKHEQTTHTSVSVDLFIYFSTYQLTFYSDHNGTRCL